MGLSFTEGINTKYRLYRVVAILGLCLPMLDIWKCGWRVPPSYSESYYTDAIVAFVLILGSLGIVFACNDGFSYADKICNRISGIAAIMVICFPCKSPKSLWGLSFKHIHYASAVVLFLTFAFMCFFVFPKIRSDYSFDLIDGIQRLKPSKRYRNITYYFSGATILIGLGIAVEQTFLGETIMLVAFGIAYLTQSKLWMKDKVEVTTSLKSSVPASL